MFKQHQAPLLISPFCHLFALVASFAARISTLYVFILLNTVFSKFAHLPELGSGGKDIGLSWRSVPHIPPVPNQGQDLANHLAHLRHAYMTTGRIHWHASLAGCVVPSVEKNIKSSYPLMLSLSLLQSLKSLEVAHSVVNRVMIVLGNSEPLPFLGI